MNPSAVLYHMLPSAFFSRRFSLSADSRILVIEVFTFYTNCSVFTFVPAALFSMPFAPLTWSVSHTFTHTPSYITSRYLSSSALRSYIHIPRMYYKLISAAFSIQIVISWRLRLSHSLLVQRALLEDINISWAVVARAMHAQ